MASTIQVRVDDELKRKSDMLFRDLGTDTTSAIRMFLTQAVANNGFPFEIKKNSRVGYNPYEPMNEKKYWRNYNAPENIVRKEDVVKQIRWFLI